MRQTGQVLVGQRVKVWWDGDGRWFTGLVTEAGRAPGRSQDQPLDNRIVYDDGEEKWHSLWDSDESWEVVDAAACPGSRMELLPERRKIEAEVGYTVCGCNGCILPARHRGECVFEFLAGRRHRSPTASTGASALNATKSPQKPPRSRPVKSSVARSLSKPAKPAAPVNPPGRREHAECVPPRQASTAERSAHTVSTGAVGRRLEIHWRGTPGEPWFPGVIKQFDPFLDPPQHLILYDDNDRQWLDLAAEARCGQLRWLDEPASERSQSGAKPPKRAVSAEGERGAGRTKAARPTASSSSNVADAPDCAPLQPAESRCACGCPLPRPHAPDCGWQICGHPWIGQRVRRLVYKKGSDGRAMRGGSTYTEGTITRWLRSGDADDEPALWYVEHDGGDDGEDLEEDEAREAILLHEHDVFDKTMHELMREYLECGVRVISDHQSEESSFAAEVQREAMPGGQSVAEYMATHDIYVGNAYGHGDEFGKSTIFELASWHAPHKTTSCRDPFVVVLPKQAEPIELVRVNGWRHSRHVNEIGWPEAHPSHASILRSRKCSGNMVVTRSVMFAALRWPKTYEFLLPVEGDAKDDPDDPAEYSKAKQYHKVMHQNHGIVTHILGEAVMPALASAIMRCAASAAAPHAIETLIDLCCCGGGFSLGAAQALPWLRYLVVLGWVTSRLAAARAKGVLTGGAGFEQVALGKCCVLRAACMSIPDELAARMPLAYVHFTHCLVDILLLIAPFGLYPHLGVFAIPMTGVISLFYRGLLELSKSFLDPFGNRRVSYSGLSADISIDCLIGESNAGSLVWPQGARRLPF